jgi:sorbitol/mannitol transport system substrate-binding protein
VAAWMVAHAGLPMGARRPMEDELHSLRDEGPAIRPGARGSTDRIPQYDKAARVFARSPLHAMASAPVDNPGTTKRPGNAGVHYVGTPEFRDVGNPCTEQFSAVITGRPSIDAASENRQGIASRVTGSR